ncbi:hypothetical protein [Mesorhizobium sp. M1365]|uniref:hypothetical protein n=1 Tax=Mesorhizobium sp. M1365 TaxID=2957090 RepID=UPI0033362360
MLIAETERTDHKARRFQVASRDQVVAIFPFAHEAGVECCMPMGTLLQRRANSDLGIACTIPKATAMLDRAQETRWAQSRRLMPLAIHKSSHEIAAKPKGWWITAPIGFRSITASRHCNRGVIGGPMPREVK